MGKGYWILLWDGYGAGLTMINPRFLVDGKDMYGNPLNWWPANEYTTDAEIITIHRLNKYKNFKILWDI